MGWFSKFFGEKEVVVKETASMDLAGLSTAIDEKLQKGIEKFDRELESFYSQMKSGADSIQEKIKILEKAAPTERVDFRLLKIATSNRDESVRKLKTMLREFRKPVSIDLDSFVEFHNSCASSLNSVNEKLARHFSTFEEIFRHETAMLMSEYKSLYKMVADIGKNLKSKKAVVDPLHEIKNHIETMNNLLNHIRQNDKAIENLNSELETMKIKSDSLKGEILNLVSGKEWYSFQNMLREDELLDKEIKDVEGKMVQTIASVDRELKKYYHLPDSHGKKFVEFYLKDPVAACLFDKNQTGMKNIMSRVETAIIERKVMVNDKKEWSVLNRIREIKDGSLEFLVKRHEASQNKKLGLDSRLEENELKKVKNALEYEMGAINRSISEIEGRTGKLKDVNDQKRDEIDRLKVILEKSVKTALNQDITITLT